MIPENNLRTIQMRRKNNKTVRKVKNNKRINPKDAKKKVTMLLKDKEIGKKKQKIHRLKKYTLFVMDLLFLKLILNIMLRNLLEVEVSVS
jgi:hypothetical protein